MLTRERVVVTGAAGFVGQAVVRAFSDAGFEVTATDCVRSPKLLQSQYPHVQYVIGDVADPSFVSGLVRRRSVGGIVHGAAYTPGSSPSAAVARKMVHTAIAGTVNIAREAEIGRLRVVLISSAAVYPRAAPSCVTERDADGGGSLYGALKLACEEVVVSFLSGSRTPYCFVRPTALYGRGESSSVSRPKTSAVARAIEVGLSGRRPVPDVPDLSEDWLHVDDCAGAIRDLYAKPDLLVGPYTVSSGELTKYGTLFEVIAHITQSTDAPEEVVHCGQGRHCLLSNDALRTATGWRPVRSLRQGLQECAIRAATVELTRCDGPP